MNEISAAIVFEEWKKRYDENPDLFPTCEEFAANPPKSYGDGAARYFLWLFDQLNPDKKGQEA